MRQINLTITLYPEDDAFDKKAGPPGNWIADALQRAFPFLRSSEFDVDVKTDEVIPDDES